MRDDDTNGIGLKALLFVFPHQAVSVSPGGPGYNWMQKKQKTTTRQQIEQPSGGIPLFLTLWHKAFPHRAGKGRITKEND